jgi:4-amino-4-deoxy-L-arabinose transferase-like glycosyltransferase
MTRTEWALSLATLAIGAALWNAHQVVVADQAHYITSGTNLISGLGFTNPAGEPEVWFPPLYPILIGLLAVLMRDGLVAAKVISLVASVVWVVAVYRTGTAIGHQRAGLVAAILLLCQPDRALFSVLSMSQGLFSALLWSAMAVHVSDLNDQRPSTAPVTGLLLGLAALTRPEAILPTALLIFAAGWRHWRNPARRSIMRTALVAGCFALVVAPYSLYLYRVTGSFSLTGKSPVTLALGRSAESGEPVFRINPATSDIDMNRGTGGVRDLVRYARNTKREAAILGVMLDAAGVVWLGLGCWVLLGTGKTGARALAWTAAPLVVIPYYLPAPAFVLPFVPAFLIPAAIGLTFVWDDCRRALPTRLTRAVASVLVLATFGWTIIGGVHDMTSFYDAGREAVAERLAGEWLGRTAGPSGRVASVGGTIAYYAHLQRRRLTSDPLSRVVEYMRVQRIQFLGVSDRDRGTVHPTVANLIDHDAVAGLHLVHTAIAPNGSICRLYELK